MALHIKVRRTRPRVYLHDEFVPELVKRTETTHVDEWSQLVVWSRAMAKTPSSHRLREEGLPERARRAAFLHALRRDEKDTELALELAPPLAALAPSPAAVEALAQVYDSLWAVLPAAERSDLAERLLDGARSLYDERIRDAAVLAGGRTEAVAPVFAAGLALYGDRPEANALIGGAVHAARDLMGTLQYFLEEDGGFPLGWERSIVHAGAFPKLAMLAESGLGQRLPDDIPWLAKYAEFLESGARGGEDDANEGPYWPGGGSTGRRRPDLWRVLASAAARTGSPAAARLLARVDLAGHQDDRILHEKRPLPRAADGKDPPGAPEPSRATFYRRAGVALFREGPGAGGVEAVVSCPAAALDGDDAGAGTLSLALDGRLVLGAPERPSMLSVTGPERAERRFPRARRELNLPENRLSEVLAFEAAVGGEFDWMQADLTPAFAPAAGRAVRTVVFLHAAQRSRHAATVVADEVLLADDAAEVLEVHHFAAPPETDANEIRAASGPARLRCTVVLPPEPRLWVDEPLWQAGGDGAPRTPQAGEPRSAWRVRIAPPGRGRTARFCQVFAVSGESETPDAGARAALMEGAWGAEAAGRVVIFGEEGARRVEGVTSGEMRGVVAVGLAPGARVTLEVAGAGRTERAATDLGAAWLDAEIPKQTGFVVEIEPPDRPPSGRAREEARGGEGDQETGD